MKEIILMMGIPCSGKSTRAKELAYLVLPGSVPILNRDTIRQDLARIEDLRKREEAVKAIQKTFLVEALKDPSVQTIIVDDAGNLKPETHALIRGWVAESGVEAKISFDDECLKTPVEVCIKRDAKRANGVGADVIRQWAQLYLPSDESLCHEAIWYEITIESGGGRKTAVKHDLKEAQDTFLGARLAATFLSDSAKIQLTLTKCQKHTREIIQQYEYEVDDDIR